VSIENISFKDEDFAIVLRSDYKVQESTFFTSPQNSMQLGVIKHEAGYLEKPHIHKKPASLPDIQQVLFITKGKVQVDFFDDKARILGSVVLKKGDTILLMSGGHAIRVIEDLECFTVKQGPYKSIEEDKMDLIKRD